MQKFAVTSLLVCLTACSGSTPSIDVVKKIENSDASISASLVRLNYDATVPYVYKIFVDSPSATIDYQSDSDVIRTDSIDNLEFSWSKNGTLDIVCITGRVFKFNNFSSVNTNIIRVNLNTNCIPSHSS